MNPTTPSATGGYIAVAALIAAGLGHFGIIADPTGIEQAIGGIVSLAGLIHVIMQHFKLKAIVSTLTVAQSQPKS